MPFRDVPIGLLERPDALARRAEPFVAVAVATWGDLDQSVAGLYAQAAACALTDPDLPPEWSLGDLPTDLCAARGLATTPTHDEWGRVDGWQAERTLITEGPDSFYDSLRLAVAFLPEQMGSWVYRNGLPTTVATRRRALALLLERQLYPAIHDEVDDDRDAELAVARLLRDALGRLSPETALPLLLADRVGKGRRFTFEQIAEAVGVSVSAVRQWRAGTLVPDDGHVRYLNATLELPVGSAAAALADRVPPEWTLAEITPAD